MKNYICTSEGFLKSAGFSQEKQDFVIEYTDKIREAREFNTKAALKFMENHGIKGFVWKPYEEDPIRNMYVVKKIRMAWKEEEDEKIQEWQPVKAMMESESDVAFLISKKLKQEGMMTFEEAKAEALRLNMEMLNDLNEKIKEISVEENPTFGRNRPN